MKRNKNFLFANIYANIIIFAYTRRTDKMRSLGKRIELLRAIAHPTRIRILEELIKGVKCVSDFEEFLEISQPNVSQHLSLLRRYGVIDYYVDGRLKCYFLVDPIIPDLIEILKKDYIEGLPAPACCPATKKGRHPSKKRY